MVVISAAFGTNKIANHFIFNRSDIVSAIGAFTAGILSNLYCRKMGGTAFPSMVMGVLFLVPARHFCFFFFFHSADLSSLSACAFQSGLSVAGGITADSSGIDIGGAMIAVSPLDSP